jgi:hypothetical protein
MGINHCAAMFADFLGLMHMAAVTEVPHVYCVNQSVISENNISHFTFQRNNGNFIS